LSNLSLILLIVSSVLLITSKSCLTCFEVVSPKILFLPTLAILNRTSAIEPIPAPSIEFLSLPSHHVSVGSDFKYPKYLSTVSGAY